MTPWPASERFVEALGLIPDTSDTRSQVIVNDYARARDVLGIPLPEGDEIREDLKSMYSAAFAEFPFAEESFSPGSVAADAYFYELHLRGSPAVGPWISGFGLAAIQQDRLTGPTRRYLGFDRRDVDVSVLAGFGPPRHLEAVIGRFDPQATDNAIQAWRRVS